LKKVHFSWLRMRESLVQTRECKKKHFLVNFTILYWHLGVIRQTENIEDKEDQLGFPSLHFKGKLLTLKIHHSNKHFY